MRRHARRQQNTALLDGNRKWGNPNDPDRPHPGPVPLSKVLGLAKDDQGQIAFGLFMLLLSSICNLSLPKIAGDVVDVVAKHSVLRAQQPMQPLATNATFSKTAVGIKSTWRLERTVTLVNLLAAHSLWTNAFLLAQLLCCA